MTDASQAAPAKAEAGGVVALVGRPNVGKSTIFNRLTHTQDAIVADYERLTRDRRYGRVKISNGQYIVIDTAGLDQGDAKGDEIGQQVHAQTLHAIEEADLVLFVTEARSGMLATDADVANLIRRRDKPCIHIVNKIDGVNEAEVRADASQAGLGEPVFVSAAHNNNIAGIERAIVAHNLRSSGIGIPSDEDVPRVAVIGRPNAGKSTLINRLSDNARLVVSEKPGTTRDSVELLIDVGGEKWIVNDTSGIRRPSRIGSDEVEEMSIGRAILAIQKSDVVVLLIDCVEGLAQQDLRLLHLAAERVPGIVIGLSKWDLIDDDSRKKLERLLDRRLTFADWIEVVRLSPKTGRGVKHLLSAIGTCLESGRVRPSTARLTYLLQQETGKTPPPTIKGRRPKARYAHVGGTRPLTIVIHGTSVESLPPSYVRHLENVFRKELHLVGAPVRIQLRNKDREHDDNRRRVRRHAS